MKDTKAILQKILTINEHFPGGLPEGSVNVGCDVKKLYPSVDKLMGLAAVRKWLVLHPNPDGLPTELIMELAQICVDENTCEFLGHFYCPNSGTATGPPHACDFADIFMGELDEKMVRRLDESEVQNTGWTIYRDDGWLVAINGEEDNTVIEEILQNLHPNIEWEVNPRGPSILPFVNQDGSVEDRTTLEHLDLTIHFVENKLETDIFAKDIPIYVSTKSCHPPQVFKSVAKSVGLRLRMNCSLDRFLTPRIEEYTRYLVASNYNRKEVEEIMGECKQLDREELIRRPRKEKRNNGPKKYIFCSKWDPRGPNIHTAIKKFQNILYMDKENEIAFPPGSLISGFRRQKNVGEIIAPSKPVRVFAPSGIPGALIFIQQSKNFKTFYTWIKKTKLLFPLVPSYLVLGDRKMLVK